MIKNQNNRTRKDMKREMVDNANIYGDGLTYHEIANILGLEVYQVKKIESDALRKLKAPSKKNRNFYEYNNIGSKPTERIDI